MEVYINGKKYVEASAQPLTHYTFNDILIANTRVGQKLKNLLVSPLKNLSLRMA